MEDEVLSGCLWDWAGNSAAPIQHAWDNHVVPQHTAMSHIGVASKTKAILGPGLQTSMDTILPVLHNSTQTNPSVLLLAATNETRLNLNILTLVFTIAVTLELLPITQILGKGIAPSSRFWSCLEGLCQQRAQPLPFTTSECSKKLDQTSIHDHMQPQEQLTSCLDESPPESSLAQASPPTPPPSPVIPSTPYHNTCVSTNTARPSTSTSACSSSSSSTLEHRPSPKDFERIKQLGFGNAGFVYLVRNKLTGQFFAMKVVEKSGLTKPQRLQRVLTEKQILSHTNHPFIASLYMTFQTSKYFYFVLQYCAGGEFLSFLQAQPGECLTEAQAKFYACEVFLALEYLHSLGIIYRDLKPENILLHETGHIVLSDFDLAIQQKTKAITILDSKQLKKKTSKLQLKRKPYACPKPTPRSSWSHPRGTTGPVCCPVYRPPARPKSKCTQASEFMTAAPNSFLCAVRNQCKWSLRLFSKSPNRTDRSSPRSSHPVDKTSHHDLPPLQHHHHHVHHHHQAHRNSKPAHGPSGHHHHSHQHPHGRGHHSHNKQHAPHDPHRPSHHNRTGAVVAAGNKTMSRTRSVEKYPVMDFESHLRDKSAMCDSFVGTHEYVAPEIIHQEGYDSSVDWWAFGVLIYEMVFGTTPFRDETPIETLNRIADPEIEVDFFKFLDPPMSAELEDLLKRLLCKNPAKRLRDPLEIRHHPFFKDVQWSLIRNQMPPILPKLLSVDTIPETDQDDQVFKSFDFDDAEDSRSSSASTSVPTGSSSDELVDKQDVTRHAQLPTAPKASPPKLPPVPPLTRPRSLDSIQISKKREFVHPVTNVRRGSCRPRIQSSVDPQETFKVSTVVSDFDYFCFERCHSSYDFHSKTSFTISAPSTTVTTLSASSSCSSLSSCSCCECFDKVVEETLETQPTS